MTRAIHTRRAGRRGERGAALLLVMVAIAILTALAADVAYENRVRLQIAANGRDALRAEGLAKSAVNLSRLVLAFQAQVDQASQQLSGALSGIPGLGTPPGQPPQPKPGQPGAPGQPGLPQQQPPQGGASGPRIQIWSMVPVNSGLVQALFGGAAAPASGAQVAEGGAKATAAFGDFEGAFEATMQDEGTKVNLQFDSPFAQTGVLGLQVESYLRMVCDPKWDAIFDREDANGQKTTRQELAVHLRDWADDDERSSALAASFPGGGNCNFVLSPNPFEQGFSDENYVYDRGRERYRAKNARLDSVDELYLVAGVSDAFMAAFGDAVTVYQPRDAGMNVNSMRPEDELRFAAMMVNPSAIAGLADPKFPERLHKALSDLRMGGFMTITPQQFAAAIDALGVPVKPEYLRPAQNATNTPFTDKTIAYRIHATGAVGDVEKQIDAVVTFDPRQNDTAQDPNANKPLPGRLIHWREE